MKTRVLLIDDHELTLAGYKFVIDQQADLELVASAGDCASAKQHLQSTSFDVVVLDLTLPDGEGLELVELARQHHAATRFLAMSAHQSRDWICKALQAGCHGYLDKTAGIGEIASAIRAVQAGRCIINVAADEILHFFDQPHENAPRLAEPVEGLSERENEVLVGIAQGMTNQQLADQMFLSVKTIETYRSRLMRKLGIRSRSELYKYAQSIGMLS